MMKFAMPVAAAALLLVAAPAFADSETRVEETYEERDGFDERSAQRSLEIEREKDGDTRSVERKESIEADDGQVERRVEEKVTNED
ncbi:MAG TPA: hypothetical protein VIS07_15440 [Candidatus Binatia bacterium]